tara:strand:- start:249 stop:683 length:435 start_codon:yes stop_codon:yes gene_type:complete
MTTCHLLKINFNDKDFSLIHNIRKTVFSDELQIPESELFDDFDHSCDHFLIFNGRNIVGSIRIIIMDDKIKLERMAILNEYRKKSYGKLCISQIKEYYSELGFSQIILDSIYAVKNFYKQCGFLEEGKTFQRVGIDHIRMSLML